MFAFLCCLKSHWFDAFWKIVGEDLGLCGTVYSFGDAEGTHTLTEGTFLLEAVISTKWQDSNSATKNNKAILWLLKVWLSLPGFGVNRSKFVIILLWMKKGNLSNMTK